MIVSGATAYNGAPANRSTTGGWLSAASILGETHLTFFFFSFSFHGIISSSSFLSQSHAKIYDTSIAVVESYFSSSFLAFE